MPLYLYLMLGSIIVPLAFSFDKKLQFYKRWKHILPSILVVAALYIGFDVLMTAKGVWGFNEKYLLGISILNLPLEEWLFFIIVPYASIFLHETYVAYLPDAKLSSRLVKLFTWFVILFTAIVLAFNLKKAYTAYILSTTLVALILGHLYFKDLLAFFLLTFLIICIPFFLVNATLTGSFIEGEIVWYNNSENLGYRFFTIPAEDFAYAFSLIFLNLMLIRKLESKKSNKHA